MPLMVILALTVIASKTVPSSAPLASDWVAVHLQPSQYVSLTRQAPKAPNETLTGIIRMCDCDPVQLTDALSATLRDIPSAVMKRDAAVVCGASAQHLVATGIADGVSRKNIDVYAFRTSKSLVFVEYTYTKAAPTDDDDKMMRTLCPTSADIAKSEASH